jgi:hypothetical protein
MVAIAETRHEVGTMDAITKLSEMVETQRVHVFQRIRCMLREAICAARARNETDREDDLTAALALVDFAIPEIADDSGSNAEFVLREAVRALVRISDRHPSIRQVVTLN